MVKHFFVSILSFSVFLVATAQPPASPGQTPAQGPGSVSGPGQGPGTGQAPRPGPAGGPPSIQPGQATPLSPDQVKKVIDGVSKAFVDNYIFPDTAKKMTEHLQAEAAAGKFTRITDPVELAGAIERSLQASHHDGHIGIHFDPRFAAALSGSAGKGGMVPMDPLRDSAAMQRENYLIRKSEVLPGNIGYLRMDGFTPLPQAKQAICKALAALVKTQALIIDLRNNGGGSGEMVTQIASAFFPVPTRLNDVVIRQADRMDTLISQTDPKAMDNLQLSMPIFILTSSHTFSAAEDLSYGLQSAGRAVVVGETTGGGAHPLHPFPVGEGFVAGIPTGRSVNFATHTDWEGVGVVPNVPVPQEQALEKALLLAKSGSK